MSASPTEDADTFSLDGSTDDDSGAEFNDSSSTYSFKDFVGEYVEENGRTYNSYGGEYWAPNDEKQCDYMDIANKFYSVLLQERLLLAPINKSLHNVLDLGTGTGIWAIKFAEENPHAKVIGIDVSPIQPVWVPANCVFQICDLNDPWTFQSNAFDLVHIRNLLGGIHNWSAFYKKIYRSLKPGAYIEQLEYSTLLKSDHAPFEPSHEFSKWSSHLIEAGRLTRKTMEIAETAKNLITETGFINVVEKIYTVPLKISDDQRATRREKAIRNWNRFQFESGMEGFALRPFTKHLEWNYIEVQVFLAQIRKALLCTDTSVYYDVHVIYGQKPLQ